MAFLKTEPSKIRTGTAPFLIVKPSSNIQLQTAPRDTEQDHSNRIGADRTG